MRYLAMLTKIVRYCWFNLLSLKVLIICRFYLVILIYVHSNLEQTNSVRFTQSRLTFMQSDIISLLFSNFTCFKVKFLSFLMLFLLNKFSYLNRATHCWIPFLSYKLLCAAAGLENWIMTSVLFLKHSLYYLRISQNNLRIFIHYSSLAG